MSAIDEKKILAGECQNKLQDSELFITRAVIYAIAKVEDEDNKTNILSRLKIYFSNPNIKSIQFKTSDSVIYELSRTHDDHICIITEDNKSVIWHLSPFNL